MRSFTLLLALTTLALPGLCAAAEYDERLSPAHLVTLHADRESVDRPVPAVLITPQYDLLPEAREPRSGSRFAVACYGYEKEGDSYAKRFAVYVPDRRYLPFARKAARLLTLLHGMAADRFSSLCRRLNAQPVNVWLTARGEAGGEQQNNNLYIFDLLAERSGLEWAREIAHEYGHYLLPGAAGYTDPESWANGVLGERLFLKWLLEDLGAGRLLPQEVPYVKMADLQEYCARQVAPLIEGMQQDGPDEALLAKTDRRAMNAFTAILLYMDSIYGSASIMQILDDLPRDQTRPPRGTDFLRALVSYVHDTPRLNTTLPGGRACMLYLAPGSYRVTPVKEPVRSLSIPGLAVSAAGAGWTLRVPAAGWRPVTVGAGAPVRLRWDRAS